MPDNFNRRTPSTMSLVRRMMQLIGRELGQLEADYSTREAARLPPPEAPPAPPAPRLRHPNPRPPRRARAKAASAVPGPAR